MKACAKCDQQNPDDALFCHRCGGTLSAVASPASVDDAQLWRAFIGPNADRYLEQFRKFSTGSGTRFALTWHWPAFLFDPFLWFLYRKMYLYAFVYAVGPVLSVYFTGDLTVGIVWRIMAGASANYLYFWHVKEHLAQVRARGGLDSAARERLLKDLGGVQPYVLWVGVGLHLLLVAVLLAGLREQSPEGGKVRPERSAPAPDRRFF